MLLPFPDAFANAINTLTGCAHRGFVPYVHIKDGLSPLEQQATPQSVGG